MCSRAVSSLNGCQTQSYITENFTSITIWCLPDRSPSVWTLHSISTIEKLNPDYIRSIQTDGRVIQRFVGPKGSSDEISLVFADRKEFVDPDLCLDEFIDCQNEMTSRLEIVKKMDEIRQNYEREESDQQNVGNKELSIEKLGSDEWRTSKNRRKRNIDEF